MKKSIGAKPLALPTPVWIIGTYDEQNKPNVMAASWAGICCSKPPCICVSLRKATYTYGNLSSRKAFTASIPSENYVMEADYLGLASGKTVDKFAQTKLTAEKSSLVDAPYIAEFPLVLECKLINTLELGLHTQFIGEILDVKADPAVLNEKDLPNIEQIKPFIFDPGTHAYYKIGSHLAPAFSIGENLTKKE